MRFSTEVTFTILGGAQYNADTGKAATIESVVVMPCHVQDLSDQRKLEIFGRVNVAAYEIYHRGSVIEANTAEVAGVVLHVTSRLQVRGKAVYTASEV